MTLGGPRAKSVRNWRPRSLIYVNVKKKTNLVDGAAWVFGLLDCGLHAQDTDGQ